MIPEAPGLSPAVRLNDEYFKELIPLKSEKLTR
jgi:hypothetical protein